MIMGMSRFVKVAISLPADLLAALDRTRAQRGASRSEYFREAIKARLASEETSDIERYIDGYRTEPETEQEIDAARERLGARD